MWSFMSLLNMTGFSWTYSNTRIPIFQTFRRLLIAKLQDEFENRNRKLEAFDSKVEPLNADEQEQRSISKHHMLGNIKFIGELYRLGLLQESIMHKCIKQLINKKKKGTVADMAEDLECLSQIMTTCGKRLDHPKAKSLIDQYFERMEVLRRKHADLPSRIRFMLQDVIDLRRNNWAPRRVNRDTGPKTLKQIRQEVQEIYPLLNVNGDEYEENYANSSRYHTGPGYGPRQGFQMKNYGMTPPTLQYSGGFRFPSSPPTLNTAPSGKGEGSDFDFFGPIKPRPVSPVATADKQSPSNTMSGGPHSTGPTYQNDPMRYPMAGHTAQRYPMYNGYAQAPAAMPRAQLPSMSGFPTADPTMPPMSGLQLRDNPVRAGVQQTYKSDQKPAKEIPPRFKKQKQQKMGTAGPQQTQIKDVDVSALSCSHTAIASLRNGRALGPRKTPVFTSLNSDPDLQQPALRKPENSYTKPPSFYPDATPVGNVNKGSRAPTNPAGRSPRTHPTSTPLHPPAPAQRHLSPTIRETNVDAIQPPFQQVIDNAQHQVAFGKKANAPLQERAKQKKSAPTKADVEKMSDEILDKYFSKVRNADQTGRVLADAKLQKKHLSIFISAGLVKSLSKTDEEKDRICKLLSHLLTVKLCGKDHLAEGIQKLLEMLTDQGSEVPKIKSVTSSLLARLVICDLMSLVDIGEMLAGGYHFPLFLLTLQQMNMIKGQDWLTDLFKSSKVDMVKMLPEGSQSKSAMVEILEGKQLQFLFPLVHIESKLANQIEQNCNPASIYKWIKDNVASDLHSDPGFITVLVSCCLDHVTKRSSLEGDVDLSQNPAKEIKEKERRLLTEIKPVLQKFLHESPKLQLHALYASQVFCFNKKFPKGLLLRLFNAMYEEDIVDEETYYVWKEDVNDHYLGKGKALFQVNTWLTWLHEAETEDDDADDN